MENLLPNIRGPEDIKGADGKTTEQAGGEIRQRSSPWSAATAVTWLPIWALWNSPWPLHSVYDSPRDKIIWDVGHQCYSISWLTGRQERFATLRTFGGSLGLSSKPAERPRHCRDGHSSTSYPSPWGWLWRGI